MNRVSSVGFSRDGKRIVTGSWDQTTKVWDSATGKAYFIGEPDIGRLKVSFFGPFYGAYNIIALDKSGYRYAMIAGPDRSYLWILARTPRLEAELLDALVAEAARLDFPTDSLIFVDHGGPRDPDQAAVRKTPGRSSLSPAR